MANLNYSPTVLLIDEHFDDVCLTETWLEEKGYHVRKAATVFDAVEEMTDITLDSRPSMVLFNSTQSSEFCSETMQFLHEIGEMRGVPIVTLTNQKANAFTQDAENFVIVDDLSKLSLLLSRLVPTSYAKAA